MTEPDDLTTRKRRHFRNTFRQSIRDKSTRKQQARQEGEGGVLFWMGTFGLVGWSVTVPTLIGIAIGAWIDRQWPSRYSWTLMLLFAGVVLGCWNAWFWIREESQDD
ncbi:AtpZ/AtpI family protein [Synechococcus sp. PCC 7336]|uniref:AtpZ/AtpI family protein n=1 Tax=Synechococcus sp. PCC 7336 TaxID=195250 RepID=UPI00034BC56F|nr:AtpZ/AtpI family protein [Synechococcus sp. PCC 7336]